jgi:hypothetical protein
MTGEKVGSDVLSYEPRKMSEKDIERIERMKEELKKKKTKQKKAEDEEEPLPKLTTPDGTPHEKKLGESTNWEDLEREKAEREKKKAKDVYANEHYRGKPKKKKKVAAEEIF